MRFGFFESKKPSVEDIRAQIIAPIDKHVQDLGKASKNQYNVEAQALLKVVKEQLIEIIKKNFQRPIPKYRK
jgi:hypothetical protein